MSLRSKLKEKTYESQKSNPKSEFNRLLELCEKMAEDGEMCLVLDYIISESTKQLLEAEELTVETVKTLDYYTDKEYCVESTKISWQ